jgi:hypothetical protein
MDTVDLPMQPAPQPQVDKKAANHPPSATPRVAEYYVYEDAAGHPRYRVVRTDPKGFFVERWTPKGWRPGYGRTSRMLFHLPAVLQAPEDAFIFVVEGEKDVLTLRDFRIVVADKFVATTSPGGAGGFRLVQEQARESLKDRDVVLVPDNDPAGEMYAYIVALALLDVARSVRIVRLPGLPPKGDVTDWLSAGNFIWDLMQQVRATPVLTAAELSRLMAHASGAPQEPAAPDNTLCWMPNQLENQLVRRALQRKPDAASGQLSYCVQSTSGEFYVEWRNPPDMSLSQQDMQAVLGRWTEWWATAATRIVALGHQRRDRATPFAPTAISFQDIAQALGMPLRGGHLRQRDAQRIRDVVQCLQLLHVGWRSHHRKPTASPDQLSQPFVSIVELPSSRASKKGRMDEITIAPGPWYRRYVDPPKLYFAPCDPRLFRLKPNQWHEMALGLALAEAWRLRAKQQPTNYAFTVEDLCADAGIALDDHNPRRTAERIEAALYALYAWGMTPSARCQEPLPTPLPPHWFTRWKQSTWEIWPPRHIGQELDRITKSDHHAGAWSTVIEGFRGCLTHTAEPTQHGAVPSAGEYVAQCGGNEAA